MLILVNGVRRNIIQVQGEFIEFHMKFQHQAPDVLIQMIIEKQTKVEIRNFNIFIQECPKNCKYCLQGDCDLQLFENCDKLRYKDQCVDECPNGTVAEYNQCIQASLMEIEQAKSFLQEGLSTIQKFGEEKVVQQKINNLYENNIIQQLYQTTRLNQKINN